MQVTVIEEHPLYQSFEKSIALLEQFKDGLYGEDGKKKYPDLYPTKKEINAVKTAINKLKKPTISLIKFKKELVKVKKEGGGTSLIRLKPEMAEFIGTHKKGLGDVYSNTLLTKHFSNLFYLPNAKDAANGPTESSIYITPSKELIKLFKPQLLQMQVINADGQLLTHTDSKGKSYQGFKFIHHQKLFGDHIVVNSEGKRIPVNGDDKNLKPEFWKALKKEDELMDEIKKLRRDIKNVRVKLNVISDNKSKAEMYGDRDDALEKERELKKEMKRLQKKLDSVCKDADLRL